MQKILIVLLFFSPIIADSATEKLKELAKKFSEIDAPFLDEDTKNKLEEVRKLIVEVQEIIEVENIENVKLKLDNYSMGSYIESMNSDKFKKALISLDAISKSFPIVEIYVHENHVFEFKSPRRSWKKNITSFFNFGKEIGNAIRSGDIEFDTVFLVQTEVKSVVPWFKSAWGRKREINGIKIPVLFAVSIIDKKNEKKDSFLASYLKEKNKKMIRERTEIRAHQRAQVLEKNFNIFEITIKSNNKFKISNNGKEHIFKCNSEEELTRSFQEIIPRSVQIDPSKSIFLVLMEPKSVFLHRTWVEDELRKMKVIYDVHLLAKAE